MTTTAELLATATVDELLDALLVRCAGRGLPITAWESGGVARTLLYADAEALALLRGDVRTIAAASFLGEARGAWLTLHAWNRFRVKRIEAVFCEGVVVLAVASGAGPYIIQPAALVVTDGTRRWRSVNVDPVKVTSATPVEIPVQAEATGPGYNVANGAITRVVAPAFAGMTVTNPAGTPGTWIRVYGADEEKDDALRARCVARWATLGRGATEAAYGYLATTGHAYAAQVTRARVVPGPGDGTLAVYVAGPSGPLAGGIVAAVQTWIDARNPATDAVTVRSATAVPVAVTIAATVPAQYLSATVRQTAADAVSAFVAGLGVGVALDVGRVYQAILDAVPAIVDLDVLTPAGDTPASANQVITVDVAGILDAGAWSAA